MTTVTRSVAPPRPVSVLRCYRFEMVKLLSQWRVRLLLLTCWVAPALFVAVVSNQTALPTDTVFGRWMHTTGWAGSLVLLAFSASWVLALLTSLVAGDVFAAEDRADTWRHLVVTVRSPRRVFAAKGLAALTVVVALTTGLAASGIVGGLVAVGNRPLIGLDGHLLATSDAATTTVLAWACVLAPTLAFAAVGLLSSVVLGGSPMALAAPALLALAMQLVQVLPVPVAVRLALPSHAFLAWRGLMTSPAQTASLLIGVAVALTWAVAATALAYALFLRRDFTDRSSAGTGREALVLAVAPLGALLVATAVVLGATVARSVAIGPAQLEQSLGTAYAHLYRLQTEELNRPAVTEDQLHVSTRCDKGGDLVEDLGPGNDWRCTVTWTLPGATATGTAVYQLDVTADGRYVADGDGPREVNGYFRVQTPYGDAPNPLWQVDGLVDLLHHQ